MASPTNPPRRPRVLSGLRPTGNVHIGHLAGALENWIELQKKFEGYFFIADWHALTTHYADTKNLQNDIRDKDLGTYGFLGYPVLQSADILMYKADYVPVGEDQVAHIELTREICRRFNNFYGPVFPEPQPLLTETPRVPGTDGRKMSKSYGNAIYLSDSETAIREKVSNMITDPARKRRSDPGNPDICPLFAYHKLFSPAATVEMVNVECRRAGIGCVEDKKWMTENLLTALKPIQETRRKYENRPQDVWDVLEEGSHKAQQTAQATMEQVRAGMNLATPPSSALDTG